MMKQLMSILSVVLVFMFLSGCGSSGSSDFSEDDYLEATDIPVMFHSGIDFLMGHDSLTGEGLNMCFEDSYSKTQSPGAQRAEYSLKYIEDRKSLYNETNASYKAEVGLIAKNEVSTSLSNFYKNESNSIYVLLSGSWEGPVFKVEGHRLPGDTKDKYGTYENFIKYCGDEYYYKIGTGFKIYGMFKLTFSSMEEKNTVSAKISNKSFAAKTSASFYNELGISESSTDVSIHVEVMGASPKSLSELQQAGQTVDGFFNAMNNIVNTSTTDLEVLINAASAKDILEKYAISAYKASYVPLSSFPFSVTERDDVLELLAEEYVNLEDVKDRLNYLSAVKDLIKSPSGSDEYLTEQEKSALDSAQNKISKSMNMFKTVYDMCISPTTNKHFEDIEGKSFVLSGQEYCKKLNHCAGSEKEDECNQECEAPNMCFSLWNQFVKEVPYEGSPKYLFSYNEELKNIVNNYIAPVVPISCYDLRNSYHKNSDGDYAVYYRSDVFKPFEVYCDGMSTETPSTYLSLDPQFVSPIQSPNVNYNYSKHNRVYSSSYVPLPLTANRIWEKYRLQTGTTGLIVDLADLKFSHYYNSSLAIDRLDITSVFSGRARFNSAASANIDLTGTGLAIKDTSIISLQGFDSTSSIPFLTSKVYNNEALQKKYISGLTIEIPQGDPVYIAPTKLELEYVDYDVFQNAADLVQPYPETPLFKHSGASGAREFWGFGNYPGDSSKSIWPVYNHSINEMPVGYDLSTQP